MSNDFQKTWLPSKYMDENIPETRPSPSDWIKPLADGFVLEAAYPEDDGGDDEEPLKDGDIVRFQWTAKILSHNFPRDNNRPIFWPMVEGAETYAWQHGDADTTITDPEQLEEHLKNEYEFHDNVEVEFYCWSGDLLFIFHNGEFHPAVELRP